MDRFENQENFIRLVQLLRDDGKLNTFFQALCRLEEPQRHAIIADIIEKMKENKEDQGIITCLALLKRKDILERINEIVG